MGSAMWIQMLLALSLAAPHPAPVDGKPGLKAAEQRARDARAPALPADQKFVEAAAAGRGGYAGGNER